MEAHVKTMFGKSTLKSSLVLIDDSASGVWLMKHNCQNCVKRELAKVFIFQRSVVCIC